jgi:hypothetical protein
MGLVLKQARRTLEKRPHALILEPDLQQNRAWGSCNHEKGRDANPNRKPGRRRRAGMRHRNPGIPLRSTLLDTLEAATHILL